MPKIIIWGLKAFVAGVAAFAVLAVFGLLYFNYPIPVESPHYTSDFVRWPGRFYNYLPEGFGYGYADKNGYMNLSEVAEKDKCDILIMGSSHMEALQIPINKNAASILNGQLNNLNVYNLGMSDHGFFACASYLENAIKFKNPKYVVIEIGKVDFGSESVEAAIEGVLDKKTFNAAERGLVFYLKQIQYLRLLKDQWNRVQLKGQKDDGETISFSNYSELLAVFLVEINRIANENGTNLIIFYHPHLQIDKAGSVSAMTDPGALEQFTYACNKAGIAFIDMTEVFLDEYATSYTLPHGFFNSPISKGHLNSDGHRMVADELARVIIEMEESK